VRPATALCALVLVAAGSAAPAAEHAVILQYHHVAEDTPAITSTRPGVFADQLAYLAGHGFRVAPLGPTLQALREGRALPDSTVCLTFDDAWDNVADRAWPMLRKRGWTCTVFVATGEVDAGAGRLLSWERMRELAAAGVTFAPHSVHHDHQARPQPEESPAERRRRLEADIKESLARLRAELGEEAVLPVYAYPYGEYDAVLQEVVRAQGLIGLGQQSGPAWSGGDLSALPRFPMGGPYGRMDDFGLKVSSLPLPVLATEPAGMLLPADETTPELRLQLAPGDYLADRLAAFVDGQAVTPRWLDRAAGRVAIATPAPLPEGRSRTNVTAPAREGRRWYWYSHPWLRLP
jgi:biofilm PGA synthesis lipoprotein PgaB